MGARATSNWRFTWEAQSHVSTLRLFLFDSQSNPSAQCLNLAVHLRLSRSLLLVTWSQQCTLVSLAVPLPRVLLDHDSPLTFRALHDHIEVKLLLLLPVDHPLLSIGLQPNNGASPFSTSLLPESEVKSLASTEGVHFLCRNCSFKLTKNPLRDFVEMPSVNWREVADNWFGACCCSFGGISEKMVNTYAGNYTCVKGLCMLNSSTVTLCKDDVVGCEFPDENGSGEYGPGPDLGSGDSLSEAAVSTRSNHETATCHSNSCDGMHDLIENFESTHLKDEGLGSNHEYFTTEGEVPNSSELFSTSPLSEFSENLTSAPECCLHTTHIAEDCLLDASKTSQTKNTVLLENQKSFLNGFLGDAFMARSSNLSADVEWTEFVCPQCSSLLGAYPTSCNASVPLDGGVRLYKCYITCLPTNQSDDLFRKYTLERIFTDQMLESAADELTFRTLIRDLTTKSPRLEIVLLNPNSWCCTGYCLDSLEITEPRPKLDLHPVVKVLFSDCRNYAESQLRRIEDSVTENVPDEVFMLERQIEEVIEMLVSAKDTLPPSCTTLQGLYLSSMKR